MKKVFLLYPYYWPNYKAGGPVQSLFNLAGFFRHEAEFYILSLNSEIDGVANDLVPKLNEWIEGPNNERIFFTENITFNLIKSLFRQVTPDVVFINGLFNISTTLPGIIVSKLLGIKIILSPRGMLQQWGLRRNSVAKFVFIKFIRLMLAKREHWHATDLQEKDDIIKHFGPSQLIWIAANIPKQTVQPRIIDFPDNNGRIKLVFLSLINPNKNLHLIIEAVSDLDADITLDIYGPISNVDYWDMCKSRIGKSSKIIYKGPIPSWKVSTVLPDYHFFILPTQGENFGHAIFDALASGVPVVISRNTPWKNIDETGCGFYVDLGTPSSIFSVLSQISKMSDQQYQVYRVKSLVYANDYWNQRNYKIDYKFLITP